PVEHNNFNVGVLGSNPSWITHRRSKAKKIPDNQALSGIFVLGQFLCLGQNKASFTCEIGGVSLPQKNSTEFVNYSLIYNVLHCRVFGFQT
ncbi:MAG: hypothetical protein K2O69_08150, partial [Odoribacter sp.]|nr:hypothetical protein [Odoribacter sp.]